MSGEVGTTLKCLAVTTMCAFCACPTSQAPAKEGGKGYNNHKAQVAKASVRTSNRKQLRKGGGRYVVGKAYVVRGKRYNPKQDRDYDSKGIASWYGAGFHGRLTANGEIFDKDHLSAAHSTLPLPSYVRVTNLENRSSLIVRVNDRGPFHKGRIIDLSSKAADLLDLKKRGTATVRVQYVGLARMDVTTCHT
ncbi:septal ring lytic transglycosylase RlpA family protein [Mycoplana dimorpha]|uniref:Endolytic peptidoglycan transglycosylase RlpA n=1 Tax=Mycoplana dimorpha TaxID=28320 RepID=A0A2T5BJB4_MYCDI|nr:rare lipoprotein A [Mycoplana dimorpha]